MNSVIVDMLAVADVLVCCSQRSLAEIVEMIHTAGLIHKGIVNNSSVADESSSALTNSQIDDLELGNKMAVLSGDFLLANASTGLAALNNTQVYALVLLRCQDLATRSVAVIFWTTIMVAVAVVYGVLDTLLNLFLAHESARMPQN